MITLMRVIVWALIFFIVYKTINYVKKVLSSDKKTFNTKKSKNNIKYNIHKEDIIDADFEEIKSQE